MVDTITYLKNETQLLLNHPENIVYRDAVYYKLEKEDTLSTDELKYIDVLDVNRYDKDQLQQKIINFVT